MNIKQEPVEEDYFTEQPSTSSIWIDVPIKRSNSPENYFSGNDHINEIKHSFEDLAEDCKFVKFEVKKECSIDVEDSSCRTSPGQQRVDDNIRIYSYSEDGVIDEIPNTCDTKETTFLKAYVSKNREVCPEMTIHHEDLKRETVQDVKSNNSHFSIKHKSRSNTALPELEAMIKVQKVNFYKKNFVCSICYDIFPSIVQYNVHKLIHRPSTSEINGRLQDDQLKNYTTLNMLNQIGDETIRSDKVAISIKNQINDNKKSFKCDVCEFECLQATLLEVHKWTHCEVRPFQCPECNFKCTLAWNLKSHQKIHSGEKPYKCPECEYTCARSDRLKAHKMIHSGEKPLKCDKCDYTCTFSGSLRVHKLTHSGEKPFKCGECEYTCTHPGNLKVHKMTHTGEKPYKCDQCSYTCILARRLKAHKMSHTGEKPFKCDKCNYACTKSTYLKLHKKTH